MGGARERGEDLLAVDPPAAVDARRGSAEGCVPGGRRAALGERLRVDGAVAHHTVEVHRPTRLVLGALLLAHLEIVGEQPGPEGRAGVHVESEGSRPAILAQRRRYQRVGFKVRTAPAVLLGHAYAEQAGGAELRVVLVREAGLAIVALGALRERGAERVGERNQLLLLAGQPIAGADDRAHSKWRRRKPSSAALKASGWSMGPKWPQPSSTTSCAPGIFAAIRSINAGGAVLSSLPSTSSVGTPTRARS